MEESTIHPATIILRATFLANLFTGSHVIRYFQLSRGYQPSLLYIPSNTVSEDLLNTHKSQTAIPALQKVSRSRTPNMFAPTVFIVGNELCFCYKSSNQNEPDEWVRAIIVRIYGYFLEVCLIKNSIPMKGMNMKPAYEDILIIPNGELAMKLTLCPFEEELSRDKS